MEANIAITIHDRKVRTKACLTLIMIFSFLNDKYIVDVNQKTLERVKNYFK